MSNVERSEKVVERAERLFAGSCVFLRSVLHSEQLPLTRKDEFAFAGRSNVGKSSLINALTRRKILAKTSNTPGRTRELNFYSLGEHAQLVDMPGYGYARASKKEMKSWTSLIRTYLAGRAQLRRVFLLIDARRGIGNADRDIMDLLDRSAVVYQTILTKIDKLPPAKLQIVKQAVTEILMKRPAAYPGLLATSSRTVAGVGQLRIAIFESINQSWEKSPEFDGLPDTEAEYIQRKKTGSLEGAAAYSETAT